MSEPTPMMEDLRVLAYRKAHSEVDKGMRAKPGAGERYRQALLPYVECMAEHSEPHIRPHMMLALFNHGIPLGVIAVGFKATEEELEPIRNLPELAPEPVDEVTYLRSLPYGAYLKTPHWQKVRAGALERADGRCAVCNSGERLEVHHRDYSVLGRENPADVTVLCAQCHSHHHGTKRQRVA